ncbi:MULTISPECIES: TetR/AcrR family transcriptional regulator [Spirosoma]|uniref:TetR/AcrR family transcriptional regulator n=1 Tax=Spirosoma sordidisoli TaxID=2502893 RepID=A0A4Q2UJM4_9BACT|nr:MULTISPECIES: TetR/AcrR family transcriptional regulator [Spirosoma]RYC69366.1 TetR/AcrR family transcriptional regulator [Spirosoma sordidisoli]
MGVAERKAREKEELRDLILRAARKLFTENGIEQTTIRNIAEAIDYSVGTVYVYFRNKDAILHALHSQGFGMLASHFSVLASVADPMERLRAMGRIYIKFGLENRDMYELMFSTKAPMTFLCATDQPEWDEGKATFTALSSTVAECLEAGHFAGHSLQPLSFMFWSLVHGMCSLEISQRTQGVNLTDPSAIVDQAYTEFLKLLDHF